MGVAKVAPGVPLETLTAGTGVWIAEDGTLKQWIYLGKDDSGNCQLLRDKTYGTKRMNASTLNVINYDGTEMDTFLQGEYLARFTSKVHSKMVATAIPHRVYDSTSETLTTGTMSRKSYIPTYFQLGYGDPEGGTSFIEALKAYKNSTSNNNARITQQEGGTENVAYWVSTAYPQQNRFRCTHNNGGANSYAQATVTTMRYRPMLSFNPSTPVIETADGYVIE